MKNDLSKIYTHDIELASVCETDKRRTYLKVLFIKIFISTSIILPIRILYMMSFNIIYGEVAFLKSIFSLTITFFELPTGIIADKISRKKSLMLSAIFFSIHSIFYLICPNLVGFTITQVCLALSTTFMSGADSAYLHEYIEKNTKDEYVDVASNITFFNTIAAAVFSIISSILFNIDNKLNFIITAVMGLIALCIITSLPEGKVKNKEKVEINIFKEYLNQIRNLILYFLKDKYLLSLTVLTAINFSFLIFNFEYYQILLKANKFPIVLMGILYSTFMILGGVGSKISAKIIKRIGGFNTLRLYTGLIAISYTLFSIANNLLLIFVGIVIQQICFGGWGLLIENVVLEKSPSSDVKSTMASLNSLIINLFKGFLIIVLGIMTNYFSYKIIYVIMAIILIIILGVLRVSRNSSEDFYS